MVVSKLFLWYDERQDFFRKKKSAVSVSKYFYVKEEKAETKMEEET